MTPITEQLTQTIQDGLQEKKGHQISIVDLSDFPEAVCRAFVICTGNSPSHVQALTDSVEETMRKQRNIKPIAIAGKQNALWVAMDYGDVMVHIFLEEMREFYDLEHLWADAPLLEIPDLD